MNIVQKAHNLECLRLSMLIRQQSPERWEQLTKPVFDRALKVYEALATERLRMRERDVSLAGPLAIALLTMIVKLADDCIRGGSMISVQRIDQAFEALLEILGEGYADEGMGQS